MNRKVIIPTIVLTGVLAAGSIGITVTHAQNGTATRSTLVQKIAQRFNLKEQDVQDVVNELRDEHQANRYALWATKLDELVSEGTITSAQKQLLLDKEASVHEQLQSLQGLSAKDRQTKRLEIAAELKKWAEENKIDLTQVKGLGFGLHMRNEFKERKYKTQ